ncbi:MAG: DUF1294 domain-containing protein [Dehalococcoidia bacterium]
MTALADLNAWWLAAVPVYMLAVNITAAGVTWWDKRSARMETRRIRERTLFTWAFLGGFIGGLWAMSRFRHKTAKRSFMAKYALAILAHLAVWVIALYVVFG